MIEAVSLVGVELAPSATQMGALGSHMRAAVGLEASVLLRQTCFGACRDLASAVIAAAVVGHGLQWAVFTSASVLRTKVAVELIGWRVVALQCCAPLV